MAIAGIAGLVTPTFVMRRQRATAALFACSFGIGRAPVSQRVMQPAMLRLCDYLQVLKPIVLGVLILVMNKFVRLQETAQRFFHDQAMLSHVTRLRAIRVVRTIEQHVPAVDLPLALEVVMGRSGPALMLLGPIHPRGAQGNPTLRQCALHAGRVYRELRGDVSAAHPRFVQGGQFREWWQFAWLRRQRALNGPIARVTASGAKPLTARIRREWLIATGVGARILRAHAEPPIQCADPGTVHTSRPVFLCPNYSILRAGRP